MQMFANGLHKGTDWYMEGKATIILDEASPRY